MGQDKHTQQELIGCFNPAIVIPVAVVSEGLPVTGIAMRYQGRTVMSPYVGIVSWAIRIVGRENIYVW